MIVNVQPKELYHGTEHGHVFKPGDKCFLYGMQEHPELDGEIVTISAYRQDDVHGRAYYITSDNQKVYQQYNWLYEIRMAKEADISKYAERCIHLMDFLVACFLNGDEWINSVFDATEPLKAYSQVQMAVVFCKMRTFLLDVRNGVVSDEVKEMLDILDMPTYLYPLDGKLVHTTTELVFGNPGERRLLPKGSPGIAKAARNLPEGNQISYWLMPTKNSVWPADVVSWANDVGCGVYETDISFAE